MQACQLRSMTANTPKLDTSMRPSFPPMRLCAPLQVLISSEDQRLAEEAEEWEAANTRRLQALTSLAPMPSTHHRQVCACSRQVLGTSSSCPGTSVLPGKGANSASRQQVDAGKHVMFNMQHVGCLADAG